MSDTTATLKQILHKVKPVRRNFNGWEGTCPAHPDHKPSLSIAIDAGKILLHCHAGCRTETVVQKLGLQMPDLFPDQPAKRKLVAAYDYLDESGALIYQIVRYKPKYFQVRRPDGNDGWIYDKEGVQIVPYQLPTLLKTRWILVTEGEKDADAARRYLRVPSTTNPFGAGKWPPEFAKYFVGKTVVLIPDHDDVGRDHMRAVASLLFGVARSVRIVELPFGIDLTEWVRLGGSREQLRAMVKAASPLTAKQIEEGSQPAQPISIDALEDKSFGELLDEPEKAVEWLVDGLLPIGGSSLLSAKAKVGKTTLARCGAAEVLRGGAFLGRKTQKGGVLYFVGIEEKKATVSHFRKLGIKREEPLRVISASATPKNFLSELEERIRLHKPKFVVLDPFARFLGFDDINDYAKMMKAFLPFVSLATNFKVHIMFAGHLGKAERSQISDQVLGSTAIFGVVDTGLFLRERQHYRTVQSKQRHTNQHGDLPETVLNYDKLTMRIFLGSSKEAADVHRVCAQIFTFLKQSDEAKTEQTIQRAVQANTKLFREALRKLVTDRKIDRAIGSKEKEGRGRNPFLYSVKRSRS